MKATSLGHAGLKVETKRATVLVDPWLSPEGAFLGSWFQYPDNQHLITESLFEPTAIAFSHEHLDHFDAWFLAQVPTHVRVFIPRYVSPVLREKITATGPREIIEVPPWEPVEIAEETSIFFVPEESPMNHDSAVVIIGDGRTLLDLNDARLSLSQLRSIRTKVGGAIDVLVLQGAGASWYPMCYDYPQERRRELSHQKRMAKFSYVAKAIKAVEPVTAIPFAGPPCFLDPELAQFNAEMEGGIFPDQQQVIDWLAEQGFDKIPLLLPGDRWDITTCTKDSDPTWNDFSFADRYSYLESYAKRRADHIAAVKARYPQPTNSLWEPFYSYFGRVLAMSPYFNQRIGIRVGFDLIGPGGGKWAVDFRPGLQGVFDEAGECGYWYRFDSRWLPPILDGSVPWEDFFLSLRFQASRNPDIYNDHLLGLLKFSWQEALKAVEDYETSINSNLNERIAIHAEGQNYLVQRYCPHAGQDLLEVGEVITRGVIRCLGHHYDFELETGQCLNGNCASLDTKRV